MNKLNRREEREKRIKKDDMPGSDIVNTGLRDFET